MTQIVSMQRQESALYPQTTLDRIAHAIVDSGTKSERETLERMAAEAATASPGAAAALVDWNGPEIVRLRAFGLVARTLARLGSAESPSEPFAQSTPNVSPAA